MLAKDTSLSPLYQLTGYNLANGKLNYDNVLCFYQDSNGQLWIGTQGGGLSRYDEKADRFEMLETIHMFSDNAIYSIVEDNHCNLWLATGNNRIYHILTGDITINAIISAK